MSGISGVSYGTNCVNCGATTSAANRVGKTFAETLGRNSDGTTAMRSNGSRDAFFCASCVSKNTSTLQGHTAQHTSHNGTYGNAFCPTCRGGSTTSTTSWTGGSSTAKSSSGTVNSLSWAR